MSNDALKEDSDESHLNRSVIYTYEIHGRRKCCYNIIRDSC